MVAELSKKLIVADLIIETVIPRVEVPNIQVVLADKQVEQTEKEKGKNKRKKKEAKSVRKQAEFDSTQDEQDYQTWVQDMSMGVVNSSAPLSVAEGVDNIPPPIDDQVSIGIVTEKSGTQSEGPDTDVYAPET